MNLLLTYNVNDHLSDNARASFIAASKRWNCEYMEAKFLDFPDAHPCFSKIHFLGQRSRFWTRIAYFDADMLIRSDAPSPFDACPIDKIGGVNDCQDHYDEAKKLMVLDGVHRKHYDLINSIIKSPKLIPEQSDKLPFNGGFLVVTPELHRGAFNAALVGLSEFVYNAREKDRVNLIEGHIEQAFLNWALTCYNLKYPMDNTWNRIDPDLSGKMKDYVYHFTGVDFHHKKHLIKEFPWQAQGDKV